MGALNLIELWDARSHIHVQNLQRSHGPAYNKINPWDIRVLRWTICRLGLVNDLREMIRKVFLQTTLAQPFFNSSRNLHMKSKYFSCIYRSVSLHFIVETWEF